MPMIGVIVPGEQGYLGWKWVINGKEVPYGLFLGEVVNFLIVDGLFVFIVKFLGWVMRERPPRRRQPRIKNYSRRSGPVEAEAGMTGQRRDRPGRVHPVRCRAEPPAREIATGPARVGPPCITRPRFPGCPENRPESPLFDPGTPPELFLASRRWEPLQGARSRSERRLLSIGPSDALPVSPRPPRRSFAPVALRCDRPLPRVGITAGPGNAPLQ